MNFLIILNDPAYGTERSYNGLRLAMTLKKENPDKNFYPAKDMALCANMKKINLMKVLRSLEEMIYRIDVPRVISQRARGAIQRMIEI